LVFAAHGDFARGVSSIKPHLSRIRIQRLDQLQLDVSRLLAGAPRSLISSGLLSRILKASLHKPEPQTLEEALFGPLPLWVRPVLHDGKKFSISSLGWLFNKLLHGFPYLILETERARLGRDLTKDEVDGMRGEFGLIFEGYICWLFKQWFQGVNVEIISPYYVKTAAGHWPEKDFLLIHDGIGYPFEIKALVPPLGRRQTGDLEGWLKYFSQIADQSVEAAEALVTGRGFFADKTTKIQNVKKAYPCGVTFEATPFR
jgi:hypothetical protein